ncbi:UNVERIFIED_CONTAM: hypothetical protein RMT77_016500 [Armadillidium vulgare]
MMEANLKPESMDIAYVRYEQIQDPYRNTVQSNRGGQYRPHTTYSGGTHYVETVHYDDYEGRSVVYEEVPNTPQQGQWRSGSYRPSSKNYESEYQDDSYYSPVTKTFQPKSYTKSNSGISYDGSSSNYTNSRSKSYGATNASSSSSFYSNEERGNSKVVSKPLQVKIVNPRSESSKMNYPVHSTQQKTYTPPTKPQSILRKTLPSQMQQTTYNVSQGGAKRKVNALQSAYQYSFVGAGAAKNFQDSNEGIEENGGKTPKWKAQHPESSDSDSDTDTKKKARLQHGPGTVAGGIKKRKRTPAEKHLRLKKYVQPKNALMCLNELMQGQPLKFDQEGTVTLGAPICMTIEVNGQKYKGFGSSKLSAKQAAAEAALVSFVKPPPPTEEEDKTPWGVLASFAMFKLFNEWKEGRIGMNSSSAPAASFGAPMVPDPICAQTLQTMLSKSLGEVDVKLTTPGGQQPDAQASLMSTVLGEKKVKSAALQEDGTKKMPAPAKTVPENAGSIHPVMLLHQMRPSLVYEQFCNMKGDHQEFTLKCTIDGQVFQGIGGTVKKAKYDLALKANRMLFNVNSTYTPTN